MDVTRDTVFQLHAAASALAQDFGPATGNPVTSERIEDAGGASPAAPWEFDVASRKPLSLSGASWKQVGGLLGAGLGPLLGILVVSWGLLGGLLGAP